jgi:hypothetical protein
MHHEHRSSTDHPMKKEKSYPKHSHENNTKANKAEREGSRLKGTNPDRGPPMIEGEHYFDKGYESDSDVFLRNESYPGDMQRGNEYVRNNREIISRDSKKLNRGKFSKIA